jgi:hypothetical protein
VDHLGRSSVIQLSYLDIRRADVDLAWLHVKHTGYSLDDPPHLRIDSQNSIRRDAYSVVILQARSQSRSLESD